jgi:hypothetical protein
MFLRLLELKLNIETVEKRKMTGAEFWEMTFSKLTGFLMRLLGLEMGMVVCDVDFVAMMKKFETHVTNGRSSSTFVFFFIKFMYSTATQNYLNRSQLLFSVGSIKVE